MGKRQINFFTEDIAFKSPPKNELRLWIDDTIREEGHQSSDLNFIFCSDQYLLNINREYLKHDTFTDIITFNNSEDPGKISGDIFVSVERVRENAGGLGVNEAEELLRVIIHGVLHLIGYKDKSAAEKEFMRRKEEYYIRKK